MRKQLVQLLLHFSILVILASASTEHVVTGFSEGYAKVKVDGKSGFINHQGQLVIKPVFDFATDFQGGYSHVKRGGKKSLIDTQGNVVKGKPFLTQGHYQYSPLIHFWVSEDGKTAKWGYKDVAGNVVINPQYDTAYTFSEGVARVGIGGAHPNTKWGFIDTLGQIIIEPQYQVVGDFKEGMAKATLNGRHFFINKEGEKMGDKDFRFVFDFSEGLAAVNTQDGVQGFINTVANGEWGMGIH